MLDLALFTLLTWKTSCGLIFRMNDPEIRTIPEVEVLRKAMI